MRSYLKPILIAVLVLLLTGLLYFQRKRERSIGPGGTTNSQSNYDETTINAPGVKLVRNYSEVLGNQLPPFELAKSSGERLAENLVREGNVVLFFVASDCRACMNNGDFFKSIATMRSDVRCYGVRPYDKKSESEESYVNIVPFAVYFDVGHKLSKYLGIRGVPVVVFIKDGSIKRIWGGIATEEHDKSVFNSWVTSL